VSRQLLKKPELKDVNQENIEKVLAVVDKLDTLTVNPAVKQLRQAVQILQKPILPTQEVRHRPKPNL
jgi:hypothetical protein